MSESPRVAIREVDAEQLRALHTLSSLGWRYLPRAEINRLRGHRRSQVLLDDLLRNQLAAINRIHYNGRNYLFSEENLQQAIQKLRDQPFQGLLRSNEVTSDLLQLGESFLQKVDDVNRSWSLRYIDWDDWQANAFHMTAELPVETVPGKIIRPDIVLYVDDGIPFAVIEVKRSRERGAGHQPADPQPEARRWRAGAVLQRAAADRRQRPRCALRHCRHPGQTVVCVGRAGGRCRQDRRDD